VNDVHVVSVALVRDRHVPFEAPVSNDAAVLQLWDALHPHGEPAHEEFWGVAVDRRNRPTAVSLIGKGGMSSAPVNPREVLQVALLSNAPSIILMHNHPSGDPSPSRDDHNITDKIVLAARVMGIRVLEHIIVGAEGHFSFHAEHLLDDQAA